MVRFNPVRDSKGKSADEDHDQDQEEAGRRQVQVPDKRPHPQPEGVGVARRGGMADTRLLGSSREFTGRRGGGLPAVSKRESSDEGGGRSWRSIFHGEGKASSEAGGDVYHDSGINGSRKGWGRQGRKRSKRRDQRPAGKAPRSSTGNSSRNGRLDAGVGAQVGKQTPKGAVASYCSPPPESVVHSAARRAKSPESGGLLLHAKLSSPTRQRKLSPREQQEAMQERLQQAERNRQKQLKAREERR